MGLIAVLWLVFWFYFCSEFGGLLGEKKTLGKAHFTQEKVVLFPYFLGSLVPCFVGSSWSINISVEAFSALEKQHLRAGSLRSKMFFFCNFYVQRLF